jgi:hypothetical protein
MQSAHILKFITFYCNSFEAQQEAFLRNIRCQRIVCPLHSVICLRFVRMCVYTVYAFMYVCMYKLPIRISFSAPISSPISTQQKGRKLRRVYLVCSFALSVSIYIRFRSCQTFLLHITPKKSCNIKRGVFYVTIFTKQQLGDEYKICLWHFTKSSTGNQNISQWSVQHTTWYVNRSTIRLSMACSQG